MEQKIIRICGYKSDGTSQIFELKNEDDDLPEGWSRYLEPWNHPNTAHLHSRPEESAPYPYNPPKPKRGRPPKSRDNDEEPGAELASELRDDDRPRPPETSGL